jgi:hypothetical protein
VDLPSTHEDETPPIDDRLAWQADDPLVVDTAPTACQARGGGSLKDDDVEPARFKLLERSRQSDISYHSATV